MTRVEIEEAAADCDLGRVVGPLDSLLDDEWETLHRFVEWASRDLRADRDRLAAEVEALRAALHVAATRLDRAGEMLDACANSGPVFGKDAAAAAERCRAASAAAIDAAKASGA